MPALVECDHNRDIVWGLPRAGGHNFPNDLADGTVCTPENPVGSCMVSSEGACAAHYSYGRFRDIAIVAEAS